jgi:hypothetical protein
VACSSTKGGFELFSTTYAPLADGINSTKNRNFLQIHAIAEQHLVDSTSKYNVHKPTASSVGLVHMRLKDGSGGKLMKDNLFMGFFLNPIARLNFKRATKTRIPYDLKGEGTISGGLYILRKGRGGVWTRSFKSVISSG